MKLLSTILITGLWISSAGADDATPIVEIVSLSQDLQISKCFYFDDYPICSHHFPNNKNISFPLDQCATYSDWVSCAGNWEGDIQLESQSFQAKISITRNQQGSSPPIYLLRATILSAGGVDELGGLDVPLGPISTITQSFTLRSAPVFAPNSKTLWYQASLSIGPWMEGLLKLKF